MISATADAPVHRPAGTPAALLRSDQVRLVYDQLAISQLISVLNASVLAWALWGVVKGALILTWLYAVCLVALVRLGKGFAYRRAAPQGEAAARWRRLAVLGAAVNGMAWGAASWLLFPTSSGAHQVFLAFVVGGMVAGSVTTLTPVFAAFVAFSSLALLPAVLRFIMEQQAIQQAMGWMMFVFLGAMLVIARRAHVSLTDLIRLRFENTALIGQLLAAQQSLQRSHESLEARVEERTTELLRTNQELERFAYIASHDLQEPLRNSSNFALLLEQRYRDRLDADGREFLGYIVDGMRQMRTLVDALLQHSRLGQPPRLEPTDCEALLDRVLALHRLAIAEAGATVTRDRMPVAPADTARLEQVFANLLSNALKFRSASPPAIHFGVQEQGDGWLFWVRDNGIGIDPRYAGQIFEMFERLHSHARYPGSGMGLAICRKIVESHHGRIWFDSRDGDGATFFFTLPARGHGGAAGKRGRSVLDRGAAGRGQPG